MRKPKKRYNKKFKWLIRGVVSLAVIFFITGIYYLVSGGKKTTASVEIGSILTSGSSDLMLENAIYHTADKTLEVHFVYDTGSLSNPNQLFIKAKKTDNPNKKYQLKNIKVTPNYYVIFIPKVESKHFDISLSVSANPIEDNIKKDNNILSGTNFDTIKLSGSMVKTDKQFIKHGSEYYQNLSSAGTVKLQKSRIEKLNKTVKDYQKDNQNLSVASYKVFDNVSQMTYDDVTNLADYVRSNNQKMSQTNTKINQVLTDKAKINDKIKAINNVTK